ncbi:sentrin-specific protease 8 [Penaeus vannamei]|uniref:Putative sentrin-specific protease 8 n=1 Tax=Penaeus vannamei TaxID=6689 RepID=A0A423SHG5_PENVA|nr:sentrin-specific protease 8-like [Penaeus vannamei]XP_042878997.1 sentrin-specific protease 8-like isoform X1 [Penaeus japonicus]XP_047501582.1 sentrin-specific protease 8-like [Penaeus chinensis]ROT63631.1 putative sentrin-specific protease 8 [Penaeus vannamei]
MGDRVVLSYHDCLIMESDLRLLEGRNWLNDSLISFWFEHLQHEVFRGNSRLLFISPEVTQLIKMGDPNELPIFLDPLDAKYKEYIFLPVNDNSSVIAPGGSHWSLLIYSKYDSKWYHYDSQRGCNYRDARCLVQRINSYLDRDIPATLVDASCTQQDNSYDCGAFVMTYAHRAAEQALKGSAIGTCFVDRQETNRMRDLIKSLVYSLKR